MKDKEVILIETIQKTRRSQANEMIKIQIKWRPLHEGFLTQSFLPPDKRRLHIWTSHNGQLETLWRGMIREEKHRGMA
jgi:hypothetical protein